MYGTNICLLPSKEYADELIAYSQRLAPVIRSQYVLDGLKSFPHMSILRVKQNIDFGEMADFICSVEKDIPKIINVSVMGLLVAPKVDGACWYSAVINKTAELLDIQNRFYQGVKLIGIENGLGDQFDPHFTVGRCPALDSDFARMPTPPVSIFRNGEIPCTIGWGQSGAHGQVVRLLKGDYHRFT